MILLTDEEREREIGKLPSKGYGIAVFRKDVPIECKSREDILADGIAKAQLKKVVGWILEHKETSLFNKHGNVYIPPGEFEALLKEVE